jgi:ribosomal protein S18 acetylase RimI-like enzyme
MLELVPMTESEATIFTEKLIVEYAADKVQAGAWTEEEALEKSRDSIKRLLPQGIHTENHYLYSIRTKNEAVGHLWVAKENFGKPLAFVYDILIYDEFRRRGYAFEAFQEMENLVKSWGLDTIALHVFGYNTGALELYKKLGYEITDISMAKKLS